MTMCDFQTPIAGAPPHPQPLSRKGRGEKTGVRGIVVGSRANADSLPPSPLAGERLGARGHPTSDAKSRTVIYARRCSMISRTSLVGSSSMRQGVSKIIVARLSAL
jgi:hypothetical protein